MSVSLQPKLRFKQDDGNDYPDWKENFLGKILDFENGKDYKHLLSGDIPVYGTGGFMTSVTEYLYDGKSVCIGRKGTINKPIFLTGKFWTVDTLFYTRNFKKCIPEFIYLLFQNINWMKYNEAGGVPSLSKKTICKITVNLPEVIEQNKIASFLSSVDKKIELLTKKHELLKKYKKGCMQKIFSQEIRFKKNDGSAFPNWENKSLGEICDIEKGKQLNKDLLSVSDEFPVINGGIDPSGFTNNFNCNENTICISEGGNSCGYINFIQRKFWAGGHCYVIKKINPQIYKEFLFQILKYNQEKIMRLRVGSGLPNIQKKSIVKFNINYPVDSEQQKIASFLFALDNKIDLMKQQIQKNQTFKKGLLQQMFI